jgi:GT2 family glycosyltransferase
MVLDISLILVNYKTPSLTKAAIDSVYAKSSGFTFECIVVDNSVDEKEFKELEALVGDKATLIDAKSNLGFGKANNLGATVAKGKYLYFLNTDTELINNAIYELFTFSEAHYPCIVGSNLYKKDLTPNHSFIPYPTTAKNIKKYSSTLRLLCRQIKHRRLDFNYSSEPKEIQGYVCGASLMLPKTYFDEIGGFDKDIFMYAEENLLCTRLKKEKNLKIYNVPSSKIIHLEGGSDSSGLSESHVNRMIDGNKVFYCKAYSYQEYVSYLKVMMNSMKKKVRFASLLHLKTKASEFLLQYHVYQKRYEEETKSLEK